MSRARIAPTLESVEAEGGRVGRAVGRALTSAAQAGATLTGQTKASRSGPNLSDARRAELGYGRITLRLPLDALAILADESERSGYTRGELVDAAIRAHCKGSAR